ncbi:MAG TPA: ABC transporter substrate-binding protein [Fibrobacteraceae bacterium]|nr:ABC transporter substrate-binding protein [Fibrobacteraceae bacterium]HPW94637.1 ABC transporter substrate-binding protein [Fibrobacteraceae bacterium]HQB64535.1 ABC transporter substrate-binding protein [Fibrobacteraceae bacterium]
MISIKKVITIFLVSAAFLFSAENPVSVIKKKDGELQSLIKKSSLTKNQKERIKTLLNDSFDFQLLAKKSLANSVWNAQTPAALDTFVNEFQRMVRNSSAKKLEMYRADSTVYEEAKLKGTDEARVIAHVWYKGKESVLEYKMSLVNDSWKAWDLVIDDLSTARNYKEQFSTILKTKSFNDLIQIIREKANEAE